ncbi:uncharacterized protein EI90DRAFT_3050499 [Cantharellus anzutake]|uniref:uncharacterized protein n=1 Tax=Cantharellus anzutake TaxID=1750568 RepID=UPI0019054111|nr:uncharacterized protein EI90DRAFT_3050499 [Cantharellus anzutake]KAF8333975.1 hypothetical protein EI90DRAFT_3050499 [Cantharellus anzutake]
MSSTRVSATLSVGLDQSLWTISLSGGRIGMLMGAEGGLITAFAELAADCLKRFPLLNLSLRLFCLCGGSWGRDIGEVVDDKVLRKCGATTERNRRTEKTVAKKTRRTVADGQMGTDPINSRGDLVMERIREARMLFVNRSCHVVAQPSAALRHYWASQSLCFLRGEDAPKHQAIKL